MKNSDRQNLSVMEILQTKLEDLPPSHKGLARFLLTSFDEAVFLTAAQLAKRSHTSEASVTRFAKRLGYGGFPELQEDLQALFRQNLPPKERMQRAGGVPSGSKAIVERCTETAILNIRETHEALDHQLLHDAAKRIAAAQTKYMVGLRSSASAAQLLGFQLGLILQDVRVQTAGGPSLFEGLLSVSKRDVVVAISFPRYSKWTAEALRYAKERGAATIAITDSPLSPIGQVADIALAARISSRTFAVSYVAAMLVIDCLIGMVVSLKSRESLARLDALERLLKGHDFFYEVHG